MVQLKDRGTRSHLISILKKVENLLEEDRQWPFKIEGDGNTEGTIQRPVKTLCSCREFKFSTSRIYSPTLPLWKGWEKMVEIGMLPTYNWTV